MLRALTVAVITVTALLAAPRQSAQQTCPREPREGCFTRSRRDVAFLIDRSGSIALRGQTYNAEVEGVLRALRDPTVIPYDGSTAVSIVTFAEAARVRVPLTEIQSAADAEAIAAVVEGLKCASIGSGVEPCPFGATSYSSAISTANNHLNQNRRPGARRVLLMSSDGEPNDPDLGRGAILEARNAATLLGIAFELDIILIGLDAGTAQLEANKAKIDQIVFPQPAGDLPGSTLVINGGDCNKPGAAADSADCVRQANEFAQLTRRVLGSDVTPRSFVVTTDADTAPDTPVTGNTLSLRQAIESANCNGGRATITFAEGVRGKTIRPLVPLPALSQTEITIDGCNGTGCAPSITIDGTNTDVSKGEQHSDGILIRSNLDTVRGLRVVHFKRAGVALEPVCPFDLVVRNLVEQNTLEDNAAAGVLVLNPRRGSEQVRDESSTVRNTISRNAISGSPALIDLAGDGPTRNDPGDEDEGPNTLLNFPDSLKVVAAGNTATVTGHLAGPTVAGALVEVFAVTKFSTVTVNQVNTVVLNAVSFLVATTANGAGDFSATGVALSPTGIYSATVTDPLGNTSELMFTNTARGMIGVSTTPTDFGDVPLNMTSVAKPVEITNTGNAPLAVSGCRLARCDGTDGDDAARFTTSGCPTALINPGEKVSISITFTPNACGAARGCLIFDTNDALRPHASAELRGAGVGAGQARLVGGTTVLEFAEITPPARKKNVKPKNLRKFGIENPGCAPVNVAFAVSRVDANLSDGNKNDRAFFSLKITRTGKCDTPADIPVDLSGNSANLVTIPAGGCVEFGVAFNPAIPAVADCPPRVSAADLLPNEVRSQLIVTQTGGGAIPPVNLVGHVATGLKLIDPNNVANDPLVTLTRSGGEFIVDFSVYDSNLDVNSATYEFLDRAGSVIGTEKVDLTPIIQQSCIVRGQSFTVRHKFSGASTNKDVVKVRVTVSDGTSSATATSGQVVVASAQSLLRSQGATVSLPGAASPRSSRKNVPRAGPRPPDRLIPGARKETP